MSRVVTVLVLLIVLVFIGIWLSNYQGSVPEVVQDETQASINADSVTLKTTLGDIVIELYTEEMPITTANFLTLAESGFYDGVKFHRVIPNFMVQTGDPLTKDDTQIAQWGTGGPGYTIADEFVEGLSNVRGTIAMANTALPNSGGSQFFINVIDNTGLDFDKEPLTSRHPVFGVVVSGMEVVDAIVEVPTEGPDRPIEPIVIEKLVIQ